MCSVCSTFYQMMAEINKFLMFTDWRRRSKKKNSVSFLTIWCFGVDRVISWFFFNSWEFNLFRFILRTEQNLAYLSLLIQMWFTVFTLRLRGMGSSKSRLLPSCSSRLGSSGPAGPGPTPPRLGARKGLKLSAESGGDGVEGLDWSLGADQLQ